MGIRYTTFQRFVNHCLMTALSAASIYADATTMMPPEDTGQEMIKGLALGFGLFFGIIIVLCVVCCLCCNNSCQCCCCKEKERLPPRRPFPRRRVGPSPSPSPPRSGTITRSTMVSGQS